MEIIVLTILFQIKANRKNKAKECWKEGQEDRRRTGKKRKRRIARKRERKKE